MGSERCGTRSRTHASLGLGRCTCTHVSNVAVISGVRAYGRDVGHNAEKGPQHRPARPAATLQKLLTEPDAIGRYQNYSHTLDATCFLELSIQGMQYTDCCGVSDQR